MALDPVSCRASSKCQAKAPYQSVESKACTWGMQGHEVQMRLTNVNSSFCGPILPGPGPAYVEQCLLNKCQLPET